VRIQTFNTADGQALRLWYAVRAFSPSNPDIA
jgi:hypothetical protein